MNVSRVSLRSLSVFVLLLASAPSLPAQERFEFTEVHMAMPVRIVMYTAHDSIARAAARAAYARIASLEATMSDYRPQSALRLLQQQPERWVPVEASLFDVLRRAMQMAAATDGAFDPTIGPLVALWRDARRSGQMPADDAITKAREATGFARIQLDSATCTVRISRGTQLDLGAIAKGYIISQALRELADRSVTIAMIEAGGDIVVGNAPPGRAGWTVEVPGADSAFQRRAAALVDAALSTSGPAAQFVEIDGVRHSHVVDPRSGRALTTSRTAYVIAKHAWESDALSTALTILDAAQREVVLRRFPEVWFSIRE